MAASSNPVLLEKDGAIAIVTLNRPEAMNSISVALRTRLCEIMAQIEQDDDVRVVIVTGAGERAFCAGLDLKELGQKGMASSDDRQDRSVNPIMAIETCKKPVIAAINGVAITGGLELLLACDILIASDNARFADTHARMGVVPGWGLPQKLPRLIGTSRAMEMGLSGNFVDAQTAYEWGMVTRVVPAASLMDMARKLASDIAETDPAFVQNYKQIIRDGSTDLTREERNEKIGRSMQVSNAQSADELEKRRLDVMKRGQQQ